MSSKIPKITKWIEVNPKTQLKKGAKAKKVDMDKLMPFTRKISGYIETHFTGGSKFINGDTLLARITPCLENGKTAYVDILKKGEIAFGSTEFIVLRAKKNITDSLFIYYLAISPSFRDKAISFMSGTSGRQRVDIQALANLEINLPPLEEQKRIAEVLGAFDDKIELLQKQNKTLEEMAKAIFKSWFVDFDIVRAKQKGEKKEDIIKNYHLTEELYNLFPSSFVDSSLGPIPTGWELGKLSDIANILGGFAFKSKDFTNKGIPVIKIKNIQDNHLVNFENVQYVSENIKAKSEKFVLKDSDIVMAMTGATIGKFALVINKDVPSLLNQRVAKISAKDESIHWFVYFSLLQNNVEEQVKNNGLGSAQPNISAERIGDSSIIIPKLQVEKIFNSFVKKIMEKFISNIKQIQTLTELRDTLLPRLISGKIKV